MFRMLCRITQSSKAHRTESVSVMDHEQTMGVNSRVLDQKQQNIFGRITLLWSVELQGHPAHKPCICLIFIFFWITLWNRVRCCYCCWWFY